jgi:outer membrane protein assembly factor BamB
MRYWLFLLFISQTVLAENWPGWRGPTGEGISAEKGVPIRWSNTENIAWKTPIPGEGHSSPVIWGDRVFLTTCLSEREERILICLDRRTGQEIWKQVVLKSPLETIHQLNSRASGTPATDGDQIYVTFMRATGLDVPAHNVGTPRLITQGKIVVAAYDLQGTLRWKTEAGDFVSAHGFSSCPVLFKDLVIINGDHDGDGYIVALDRKTGQQRWKTARENKTRSYVTPIIREIKGRTQMMLAGSLSVASYDPANGEQHWFMNGPTEQFVASLVSDGEHVFLTAGFPDHHILAIRPDGRGNVTDTHIAWRTTRGAAYVPSPIISGPYLLVVADSGIASCFEAKTGERYWMERLPGGHSASPVCADGHVYFVSDLGVTSVVRPGREFELVATNPIGEPAKASLAISHGQLFLRSHSHLFCIGAKRALEK